ncbi:MAG: hypothetical protein DME41_08330 [Verrucomicrobia bacterium]|nr:MAG: hypothetical protein DME41_08330 [Verrucomicrobiota bacterium]
MVCVTSPRAKIRPPRIYFHRGIVDPRGGPFSGSQPVCTITRDTSEDPAGTSPTLWRDLKNWTHERHAMEWFEAQRHHHRAGNDRHWRQLSRGETFWSANCVLFSFLATARRPEDIPNIAAKSGNPSPGETKNTALPAESRATAVPSKQARPHPNEKTSTAAGFISEVHKVSVTNGSFRFLGRESESVASFEGVGFRAAVNNASSLKGNARVARVSVRDRFFLQQLRSPLRYDANGLDLSQISAHVGGGDVTGRFTMQPEAEESPFHVEMKFRGVQADQIITEAGGPGGVLQGKLEGNVKTEGKTTDPVALAGSGEIFLHDGQLRQFNLLVALGQLFQIEELTQLHLDQAEAKYHLTPGAVAIDELVLRSANIHLSATGTVSFRGKLHLSSRLAINEKIRAQLYKPIRANFQPTEEPGYSAVDFEVNGTVERPKTNLLEKVVGRDLKDLVNSFLGGKSDKPKKKKGAPTNVESTPSPTPGTSASPAGPSPANSP